ncbi:NAD(P)H-binding protein, partial [Achromobacter xylosoxidans]
MTTLVVGASGATGRLLVGQLLERGEPVRALLRSPDALRAWAGDPRLSLVQASVLDLDPAPMARPGRAARRWRRAWA